MGNVSADGKHALAVRPLRQCRLRHRHHDGRGRRRSRRQGAARPDRLAAARPLLARPYRQHALGATWPARASPRRLDQLSPFPVIDNGSPASTLSSRSLGPLRPAGNAPKFAAATGIVLGMAGGNGPPSHWASAAQRLSAKAHQTHVGNWQVQRGTLVPSVPTWATPACSGD